VQWRGVRIVEFAARHGFGVKSGQPFETNQKPMRDRKRLQRFEHAVLLHLDSAGNLSSFSVTQEARFQTEAGLLFSVVLETIA
jgi:hypothetical protein